MKEQQHILFLELIKGKISNYLDLKRNHGVPLSELSDIMYISYLIRERIDMCSKELKDDLAFMKCLAEVEEESYEVFKRLADK